MQQFRYRGRDGQGKRQNGRIVAEHKNQAAQILSETGYYLTMLKPVGSALPPIVRKKKLKAKVFAPYSRQLSYTLRSGLPLISGLRLINNEKNDRQITLFNQGILQYLGAGKNLTEAITLTGYQLPAMFLEYVMIGENRGLLAEAITQAADDMEHRQQRQDAILTALLYPALVLVVMILAVVAMLIFVAPGIVQTYQNFDAPIPILTQGLMVSSRFLLNYGGWLVLLFLAMIGLVGWIGQSKQYKPVLLTMKSRLLLALPFARKMLRLSFFIEFSRTLGQLLEGGVLMLNGLVVIQKNYHGIFAKELTAVNKAVSHGKSLSDSLEYCTFVPEMARQMIRVGEESGRLDEMLLQNSAYYAAQFNQGTTRLTKMIEPLLVVLLGMFVLLIAGSLFLPIISAYRYIL